VPGHAHVFAIEASGLAGALDAPILPYDVNAFPTTILNQIVALGATDVYVIGHKEHIDHVFENARVVECCKNIHPIICGDAFCDIAPAIVDFGKANNLWEGDTAFVCSMENSIESFAAAHLAYANRCPFVIINEAENSDCDLMIESLRAAGITKLNIICDTLGAKIKQDFSSAFEISLVSKVQEVNAGFIEIAQWANKLLNQSLADGAEARMIVTSGTAARWQSLISVPCFAGKTQSGLLFVDESSLDNMSSAIDYMSVNKGGVLFVDNKGLLDISKRILTFAAKDDVEEALTTEDLG
jgi:ABC-2 type transport system ATP-binding protein